MKNEKKEKIIKIIRYILITYALFGLGVVCGSAVTLHHTNNMESSKALGEEHYKYTYVVDYFPDYSVSYDPDLDDRLDYAYVNGKRYDNLSAFYINADEGRSWIYGTGGFKEFTNEEIYRGFAYVPYHNDTYERYMPENVHRELTNYVSNYKFVNELYITSIFNVQPDFLNLLNVGAKVPILPVTNTSGLYYLYRGAFISNGILYTGIYCTITRSVSNGSILITYPNGGVDGLSFRNQLFVSHIYYERPNEEIDLVYKYTIGNVGASSNVYTGYTWTSPSYQNISLLSYLSNYTPPQTNDNISYQTWIDVLTSINANIPIGSSSNNPLGNVFDIISSLFASMLPFLSLQIAPNLTFGILILIPLTLTLILAIIKVLK